MTALAGKATVSHTFTYRGVRFAYDVGRNVFIRLDEKSYAFLGALGTRGEPSARQMLHTKFGLEAEAQVGAEFHALKQAGYFSGRRFDLSGDALRRYARQRAHRNTRRIELALAASCNLRCRYCYGGRNNALSGGSMADATARAAVDLLFARAGDSSSVAILFFGGEPLLNKAALHSVVDYSQQLGQATSKRVRYNITTNGTLVDAATAQYMKKHNFQVMVSIDGPPNIHDSMRPMADGRPSLSRAAAGVRELLKAGVPTTLRATLTSQCLDKCKIVHSLQELGVPRISIARSLGKSYERGSLDIGPEHSVALRREDERLLEEGLRCLDVGERPPYFPYSRALRDIHQGKRTKVPCGIGLGNTTVAADGKLYPCHRFVGMERYVIGHVGDGGVDVGKVERLLASYLRVRQDSCGDCWAMHLCGGPCPYYLAHEDGEFRPPPDWWCEETRHWVEQCAWVYHKLQEGHEEFWRKVVGDLNHRCPVPHMEKNEGTPACPQPDCPP